MKTVREQILELEERLRQAELGPDPSVFEEIMDDDMLLVSQDGKGALAKKFVVEAHKPDKGQIFTNVEMTDMNVVEHDNAAVVTCTGTYEGPNGTVKLKFMRVWLKKPDGWKIIAGSFIG